MRFKSPAQDNLIESLSGTSHLSFLERTMYKVIEAQKVVTGDQFEVASHLMVVVGIDQINDKTIRFFLETVLPTSKVQSYMWLTTYKRTLFTIIANQKELSNG